MKILQVTDPAFRKYGKVVTNVDFTQLCEVLKTTPCPDDVVYVPSAPELEALPVCEDLKRITYGELDVQVGYCNGHNHLLNAVEYHRSSEINVAATEAILLLGKEEDITDDFTYDTAKMEAFVVPAGTAVELYATTLHYAPCGANGAGFQVCIVLPKGTNYPLASTHTEGEDKILAATNKWLIGHPEASFDGPTHLGLIGKNLDINE